MYKVCICGGGSLGHVCAGVLASQDGVEVNLFTRQPEAWANEIVVTDLYGKTYSGKLNLVSNDPKIAVEGCDLIFLCIPGYAIESTLQTIKPFVGCAIVGSIVSSTGFFFAAHQILGEGARLFGFQRTPFIARLSRYGHSANLLGYKTQVGIAMENICDSENFRQHVEQLWLTPTKMLGSHYEVSLTNSNPILHTGRLFSMWKDWNGQKYDHNILFYKEWTNEASQTIIDMDAEFMELLGALGVKTGSLPSLLEYYESHDAVSLTQKISSILAFQKIASPMKEVEDGWIPDFESRYFIEDFPYGLRFIVELAEKNNVYSPMLSRVYEWGMKMIN